MVHVRNIYTIPINVCGLPFKRWEEAEIENADMEEINKLVDAGFIEIIQ